MTARQKILTIFTAKGQGRICREGGSGEWKVDRNARGAEYAVLFHHAHKSWTDDDRDHVAAWLVGQISGLTPATDGRWVVQFLKFALLPHCHEKWSGARNPVGYATMEELGIDPDMLIWHAL